MPATREAIDLAVTAAAAADDVKATDLILIEVADILALTDVFLLATASSDRQLRATAERIEERLREQDRRPLRREGSAEAGWVLLDYGDVVCHLFSDEMRQLYGLERLWSDVPQRDGLTGEPIDSLRRTAEPSWAEQP
ncbi:MAG: ribosome silencing factor [Nitriliruptoraceae bacterium]